MAAMTLQMTHSLSPATLSMVSDNPGQPSDGLFVEPLSRIGQQQQRSRQHPSHGPGMQHIVTECGILACSKNTTRA